MPWVLSRSCSWTAASTPALARGRAEQRGKVGGISLTTIDLLEKANLFCVFLWGEGFFSWLLNPHTPYGCPDLKHVSLAQLSHFVKPEGWNKILKSPPKTQNSGVKKKTTQASKRTATAKLNIKNTKQHNFELTVYLKSKWESVCWTLHLNSLFPWSWVLCSWVIFSSGDSTCTLLGRPHFSTCIHPPFASPSLEKPSQLSLLVLGIHSYVCPGWHPSGLEV